MSSFNFFDDIELVRLDIISSSGDKKSIGPQVAAIRVQEDVTSSYVFAELDIIDGISLLQTLPIVGEETFMLEMRLPRNNTILKYKFCIFAVSNVKYGEKNNIRLYTLKGVSEEALINASCLAVKGYNDAYENIISDILKTNLKSVKKITKDSTRGIHNIVLPNMKPMAAIEMLRKRSISTKNEYAPMLFFETSDGFVFKDLATLLKDGKARPRQDITYTYRNVTVSSSEQSGVISSFVTPEKHDTFSKINNGGFNNQVSTYDIKTKKIKVHDFKYEDKKKSFEMPNDQNTNSTNFIQKYGTLPARSYLTFIDSSRADFFADRYGDRQSYTNQIFQNLSRVELSGILGKDPLRAGGVVYLNFEKETGSYDQSTNTQDKAVTGYYFIKKLIHEIQLAGGVPAYRASCDVVSGVMMEKLQ